MCLLFLLKNQRHSLPVGCLAWTNPALEPTGPLVGLMADPVRAHAKEYFPELLLPVSLSSQWATATSRLCRRPSNTSRTRQDSENFWKIYLKSQCIKPHCVLNKNSRERQQPKLKLSMCMRFPTGILKILTRNRLGICTLCHQAMNWRLACVDHQNKQETNTGGASDGGRVRCGDHLPPHRYIRNTSTCGTTPTEHLLNAGRRPQTSQKARNSPTYLGRAKEKRKNRDKRIGTGPAPVGGSCEGGKVSMH